MPVPVPVEQVCILAETLGKVLFPERIDEGRVNQVGLGHKAGGRTEVLLLFPVHGDLGFSRAGARLPAGFFPTDLAFFEPDLATAHDSFPGNRRNNAPSSEERTAMLLGGKNDATSIEGSQSRAALRA